MKVFELIPAAYFCAVVFALGSHQDKGWRGIIPLHSKRTDVERLIGPPEQGGDVAVYRTKNGLVEVDYASAPCKGRVLGWNVSHDTVLQIHVAPQTGEHVTIDEGTFVKAYGHLMRPNYINLKEGLRYELLPDGTIYSISYIPSKADAPFRCPGFPPYDGGLTQYRPFDTFGDTPTIDKEARLDNFAATLWSDPGSKGYVIVYAGRRARVDEGKTEAERAREYLVVKRKVDKRRIIALDGGYRENLETDLYIVPSDLPAPAPTPTLASNEVQIIRATRRNNRRTAKPRYN